jgi:hypothetical protein
MAGDIRQSGVNDKAQFLGEVRPRGKRHPRKQTLDGRQMCSPPIGPNDSIVIQKNQSGNCSSHQKKGRPRRAVALFFRNAYFVYASMTFFHLL